MLLVKIKLYFVCSFKMIMMTDELKIVTDKILANTHKVSYTTEYP